MPEAHASAGEDAIQRWRAFVLGRVLLLSFAMLLFSWIPTFLDPYFSGSSGIVDLALIPGGLVVGTGVFWRGAPTWFRQLALVVGVMLAALGTGSRTAFLAPNAFCAHLMLVVLVALVIGRAAAWGVWSLGMLGWAVIALHFTGGAHAPSDDPAFDPNRIQAWLRIVPIYGVLSATTVAAVAYLANRMTEAVRRGDALYEALTRESGERIAALEEQRVLADRLRQSQKLESLGTLAGGVAHDFNNLLVVILNNAELASDGPLPDDVRESLQHIQHASVRAAALTGQLLAFGRRQVAERSAIDVESRLQAALQMLSRLLPESITVEQRIELDRARIWAAGVEFDQVLMNLCINARDAMPDGGRLSIEAICVHRPADGGATSDAGTPAGDGTAYVRLTVSDTGAGMDEPTQQRLFEPFFTTKAPGSGTGLGLSMVHGIVSQAGGFIELDSAPGRGTTFRVFLPVYDGAEAEAELEDAASVRRGNETILIADDDENVRRVLVRQLERWGYRVTACADGEAALVEFRRRPEAFDLVISDAVMPRRGGASLHAAIEAEFGPVPFLVCSGYTAETLEQEFFERPGRAFLSKPFTSDALARAVRSLLDVHQREVKSAGLEVLTATYTRST